SISDAATVYETATGTEQATFTVTLTGAGAGDTITVTYSTQDGTAHAGKDYQSKSDTVTLTSAHPTATISVPIIGNQLAQHNETFTVVLSNPIDTNGTTPIIDKGTGTGTIDALFTTGTDIVNFNSLQPAQITAIQNNADIYHGLGGNDVVTLPNVANYQLTSGVTWDPTRTFVENDTAGQHLTITGGDGDDHISLGSGTHLIIGSPGDDVITGGAGHDKFDFVNTAQGGL